MFYGSGYIITKRNDTKLNNNFSIFLYKKASKVIAISESIKKNLIIINKMIDVVPDGIEDIQFNNDVSIFLKNKYFNKKIIGNIAAMDNDSKGHDILINVANLLKTEKNVVFFLIGGGKKFSFFKKESEFLDNIEFTGFVENPYDYLSIMNIFLFPSLSEGLGSSILDALYLGVPVIASNVGGIPDIIQDNYNGFLVNPHNIDEIMEKINILIQNEEIRKKFIKNGFETVKNYDINLIADKYINIYKEINNEIFYGTSYLVRGCGNGYASIITNYGKLSRCGYYIVWL
ncbi:MAG: glycosyltransferase family 4 protein [Candidatus Absconditabacterales bacterium]|nr:glycosyltransferase family 4 protein [Candidatus Absconditabacterales bacterium]